MAKKRAAFYIGAEQTEETRLIAARAWWERNWGAIVGGLLLGVVGIGGWYGWQSYVEMRRQAASEVYLDLAVQEDPIERAKLLAQLEEYSDTVYLTLGKMYRARVLAEEGDLEKAAEYLRWVIDHSSQDSMALLAKYRLLRLLLAQGEFQEVLDAIDLHDYNPVAEPYFFELRGDALVGLRHYEKAATEYSKAMSSNLDKSPLLQMKLESIGG